MVRSFVCALAIPRMLIRNSDSNAERSGLPPVRGQVRKSFEVNLGLTDPKAIETAKEACAPLTL